MKTLQDLYKEIINNDELKKAFTEAAKAGKALEFIKAHGCETTEEELKAFLLKQSGELSDDELDNAAGGGCIETNTIETASSVLIAGILCADLASGSSKDEKAGQQYKWEGRICNFF